MQLIPKKPLQLRPAIAITTEVDRLASLPLEALRAAWCREFRKAPPKTFWRDLLLRTLAWRLQEKVFGSHDKAVERLLDGYAKKGRGDWQLYQRLQTGTVLVREFGGVRHTVTLVPDGFVWRENTYSSLSAIAKLITGANWNGPRFFGLRGERARPTSDKETAA